jgi:hypothetical protein
LDDELLLAGWFVPELDEDELEGWVVLEFGDDMPLLVPMLELLDDDGVLDD